VTTPRLPRDQFRLADKARHIFFTLVLFFEIKNLALEET
jgi:hypothetical protein